MLPSDIVDITLRIMDLEPQATFIEPEITGMRRDIADIAVHVTVLALDIADIGPL